ncbi:MAG: UbiA prenyltransferase family protein [Myxococcales bacterium]|nr:UbiA prenyltransferase family protein [Myxococcales bacterium]
MKTTAAQLVALARPKGALLIASLPLVGFGFGLWDRGSTVHPKYVIGTLVALFVAWVFGHAGAMWLNAVLDRDEGEVLLGEPVPVPRGTWLAGYLGVGASVGTAFLAGWPTALCSATCAVLAVLYSHPRVALKGRAFGGPLVNGVGYGILSPLGGWLAAAPVLTWRAVASIGLGAIFILGVYFAAQAFQADEDRERGYRTLVATHGPQVTLWVARGCLVFVGLAMNGLALLGAYPRGVLVGLPLWFLMDRHLARWLRRGDGGRGSDATRLVGIVTLAVLLMLGATYAHQLHAILAHLPPGGCGTAVVPEALAAICADPTYEPFIR